jgi:CcmD family protein
MTYLMIGTAIVWLAILGYVISLSSKLNKLLKQLKKL